MNALHQGAGVTNLQEFRDLDRAHDPQAALKYLDAVSEVPTAKDYKSQTFEMLELTPGKTVLDVGCGTGNDARALANRVVPGGRVVAVDISEAAIAEASKRSAGSSAPLEFRRGDVHQLDFPAGEFDAARADRVFQHLEDPLRALRELVRVTRPGGTVVMADVDWDTLVIDSPDRETTREVVHYNTDRVARNGWIGRQLRGMVLSVGLVRVEARAIVAILTSFRLANELFRVTRLVEAAVDGKSITVAQAARWLDQLQEVDRAGTFFPSATCYMVAGRKPDSQGQSRVPG